MGRIHLFRAMLVFAVGGLGAACAPLAASRSEAPLALEDSQVDIVELKRGERVATTPAPPPERRAAQRQTTETEWQIVYGYSVENRPLVAYRLGDGPVARALIGGIHGGYEWNTTALMSHTLETLAAQRDQIPPELTIYVIPLANPDGAAAGMDRVGGRMNANGVDLNRNWDYRWQMTATHGTWPVFAGARAFSEPETAFLRDFIIERDIEAVIFYHSAAGEVYSGAGVDTSATVALAKLIAAQTGYLYAPYGVLGQITTGDAIDWLTQQGITAIEVELSTHEALDLEQNLRGIAAFLNWNLPKSIVE